MEKPLFGTPLKVIDKRSVLSDHRIHRPLTQDHVAPSSRASGHRNDLESGAGEFPEGRIAFREEFPVVGNGIVDIVEDIADRGQRGGCHFGNRFHKI